jgi:Protein of unknown function (DUF4236)
MGSFRFYGRVHIFPGLTVNLSKSGPSLSVGVRGAQRVVTAVTGCWLNLTDAAGVADQT